MPSVMRACVQVIFSSFMAFCQSASFSSTDTLTMVKSLYFSCTRTRWGISARHGPHHEAQNSSMTYLPDGMSEESFTVLPSGVCTSMSAYFSPKATGLILPTMESSAASCGVPVQASATHERMESICAAVKSTVKFDSRAMSWSYATTDEGFCRMKSIVFSRCACFQRASSLAMATPMAV